MESGHRWTLHAVNEEVLAQSHENAPSHASARETIRAFRAGQGTYAVVQDASERYWWVFDSDKGQRLVRSGQSFDTREEAEQTVGVIESLAPWTPMPPPEGSPAE